MNDPELEKIFNEIMLGGPPFANDNAEYQAQALIDYFRPKLLAWRDRAVRKAEDKVIDIAHSKPCDCKRSDHLPTPVRSVQGDITKYCQFSRVLLSDQLQQPTKEQE